MSVKNVPPERRTRGKFSFKNTKSGAGEQFLPQECMAKARVKGVFLFTGTGMTLTVGSAWEVAPIPFGPRLGHTLQV